MRLSIIIPAWNVEKYITKCIESCLRLKCDSLEIIVINDGSTDDTLRIIDDNFGEVESLKVYTTKNNGLSAARNFGIEKATGDYIIFLDADDWLRTDINHLISNDKIIEGLDVLFYNCQMIDETDDNRLYPCRPIPIDFGIYSGNDIFTISRDYYASAGFFHFAWLGIYKRDFLLENNIQFINGIIYEDYDFWFKVLRHAKHIRYSNYICYAYRLRNFSITHSGFSEKVLHSIYKTIQSILMPTNVSDAYLACASAKIELLVIYGELRTSTKNAEYLEKSIFENGINEKYKIIKLIDDKYPEDNLDWLKIKYRVLSNVIFCFGIYDNKLLEKVNKLYEKMSQELITEMKKWRLNESSNNVGFYGHGVQPDIIANTYSELIGNIKAKCVYIDSKAESYRLKHYNRDVINVEDLRDEDINEVIICSSNFEKEMRERIQSMYSDIKVFSPYEKARYSLLWVICGNYYELYRKLKNSEGKKRIILIETPEYPNVGDHLIAVAEKQFLNDFYPEYEVIDITNDEYGFYKCRLKREIKKYDILVITGGGFFGGMWRQFHYDQALDIIAAYKDNKVLVMPQSVYFEETIEGNKYKEKTIELFDRDNLKIVCREHFSYELLSAIGINKSRFIQCPDIAFYRKFEKRISRNETIGLFFRCDKEAIIENKDRERLDRILVYSGLELVHSSMQYNCEKIYKQERECVVDEKLEEIASYKLVVTDQLHCMISCAITGTPCIAFNNISRKLEGVYEYLGELSYIRFLSDLNCFKDTLDDLLKLDINTLKKPDFTKEWEILADFYER